MREASQTGEQEPIFGVFNVLLLGTLMLFCALLALPLHQIHVFNRSLAERISLVLPFQHYHWLIGVLWVAEIVTYYGVAWRYSRQLRIALFGVAIGVGTRLAISVLMSLFVLGPFGGRFPQVFFENEGTLWIYHVLAVLGTCLIFATTFRGLWRLRLQGTASPVGKQAGNESQTFAFATGRPLASFATSAAPGRPSQQAFASAHSLAPPADFVIPVAASDVVGIISIPVPVILEAVPEARTLVDTQRPVRIPLALFLPQLASATIWLTWQQIFTGKEDDLNHLDAGSEAVALLRDRWIRITARNYITQVPKEYFTGTKKSAVWMRLPEVEHEALFNELNEGKTPAFECATENSAPQATTDGTASGETE